jgi:hypothetical protein
MSPYTPSSFSVRYASVVADAHRSVACLRQDVKKFGVIAMAMTALLVSGCGPIGTYCQSGPKYGTQCYSVDSQPGTNAPPNARGSIYPIATNSRQAPNGHKP